MTAEKYHVPQPTCLNRDIITMAKTGSEETPSIGLSLPQHMTDAGSVAAELWDKWTLPWR